MTDLLLSHGYFLGEDEHERRVMKPYPPLGLLYLSAYLKAQGFAVALADGTFMARPDLEQALAESTAPVVGLYTNLMTRASVLHLAALAKAAGKLVVLGGPESANYPAEYLARGADVVVFGEGEAALAELLPALRAAGPHRLHDVAGIAFRDEAGVVHETLPRAALPDLDALPWPDRDAIALGDYLACWRTHHGYGSVSLITSRGCPYRCRWCSHAVFGYSHRRRSAAGVADEVAAVVARYAPERLWFADDVFTINYRWLREYAALVRRRGLVVPFETITRADRVTDEVAEHLSALGCARVWLGSESGSQDVLDAMERGVQVDQVRWATRRLQDAGIEVGMFLMWGYEGEEEADIAATIEHVKLAAPDTFLTTVAYPIRGTPYFDEVAGRAELPIAWEVASDRDYVIHGRHTRAYYDHATRRLRHEVALHRLRRDGLRPSTALPAARAAFGAASARVGMRRTAAERS